MGFLNLGTAEDSYREVVHSGNRVMVAYVIGGPIDRYWIVVEPGAKPSAIIEALDHVPDIHVHTETFTDGLNGIPRWLYRFDNPIK